jgi:hypothetical protein
MHIFKVLYVTATTDECFNGHLGLMLRMSVFLLVPLPHVIFLVLVTLFCSTIGILYYIGKTTKIFYNHEYKKTFNKIESNVRLEPKSYLGKYMKHCQRFMEDDTKSHPIIYILKGCCATVLGVLLGALPFVPFSIAVLGITILRLPINVYKTIKIALFTVVLKWDLRIVALLVLPIIHVLFPLVVFVSALMGSFLYFCFQTSKSIYKGSSPFKKWHMFKQGIREYYEAHENFVGGCDNFDHPTGIPNGWRGDSYGIPVERIIKWQWDFLMCCFLLVIATPVILLGSVVLLAVKFGPRCISWWKMIVQYYCKKSRAVMLGAWPFFLLGMLLVPIGAFVEFVLAILVATIMVLGAVPSSYLRHGYLAALYTPLDMLSQVDNYWFADLFELDFRVFPCLPKKSPFEESEIPEYQTESCSKANRHAELYWDRFASQNIRMTFALIEANWIVSEDIQTMEPSVVQSIPAVAILTILADSANDTSLGKEDILWSIGGVRQVCKKEDRPTKDGIANLLWPMAFEVKKMFLAKKKELSKSQNIRVLTAMLCANSDSETDELKDFLKEKVEEHKNYAINNQIRTKINNLTLAILRVKPYQDRMASIFGYDYDGQAENGCSDGCSDSLALDLRNGDIEAGAASSSVATPITANENRLQGDSQQTQDETSSQEADSGSVVENTAIAFVNHTRPRSNSI